MARRTATLAVLFVLMLLLMGCFDELRLVVPPQVRVGQSVPLAAHTVSGCSGGGRAAEMPIYKVDGRRITGDVWVPDTPGLRMVSVVSERVRDSAQVEVLPAETATSTMAATGTPGDGDVAMSVDTPEPADPATLEQIMISGNDQAVYNGGTPITWKLSKTLRVREIWTYHWNDARGTRRGGKVTLKRSDGSVVGEWSVTRMTPGQGGVPNAYWIVDIDIELPAGTYTIIDSEPSTWAQNSKTRGAGMAWAMVVK